MALRDADSYCCGPVIGRGAFGVVRLAVVVQAGVNDGTAANEQSIRSTYDKISSSQNVLNGVTAAAFDDAASAVVSADLIPVTAVRYASCRGTDVPIARNQATLTNCQMSLSTPRVLEIAVKEVPVVAHGAWAAVCREASALLACTGCVHVIRLLSVRRLEADAFAPFERAHILMEYAPGGMSLARLASAWAVPRRNDVEAILTARRRRYELQREPCRPNVGRQSTSDEFDAFQSSDDECASVGDKVPPTAPVGSAARDAIIGMPAFLVSRYIRGLVLAVQHVHGAGIAHRDLKAANVLIGADGEPRLADFGSCKLGPAAAAHAASLLDSRTISISAPLLPVPVAMPKAAVYGKPSASCTGGGSDDGGRRGELGTLQWTAPEVLLGSLTRTVKCFQTANQLERSCNNVALSSMRADGNTGTDVEAESALKAWQQADVWSLGATTLELLLGRPPWAGVAGHSADVALHIAETDLRDTLPHWLPADAAGFIRLCLHPSPAARPTPSALIGHPFVARRESRPFTIASTTIVAAFAASNERQTVDACPQHASLSRSSELLCVHVHRSTIVARSEMEPTATPVGIAVTATVTTTTPIVFKACRRGVISDLEWRRAHRNTLRMERIARLSCRVAARSVSSTCLSRTSVPCSDPTYADDDAANSCVDIAVDPLAVIAAWDNFATLSVSVSDKMAAVVSLSLRQTQPVLSLSHAAHFASQVYHYDFNARFASDDAAGITISDVREQEAHNKYFRSAECIAAIAALATRIGAPHARLGAEDASRQLEVDALWILLSGRTHIDDDEIESSAPRGCSIDGQRQSAVGLGRSAANFHTAAAELSVVIAGLRMAQLAPGADNRSDATSRAAELRIYAAYRRLTSVRARALLIEFCCDGDSDRDSENSSDGCGHRLQSNTTESDGSTNINRDDSANATHSDDNNIDCDAAITEALSVCCLQALRRRTTPRDHGTIDTPTAPYPASLWVALTSWRRDDSADAAEVRTLNSSQATVFLAVSAGSILARLDGEVRADIDCNVGTTPQTPVVYWRVTFVGPDVQLDDVLLPLAGVVHAGTEQHLSVLSGLRVGWVPAAILATFSAV